MDGRARGEAIGESRWQAAHLPVLALVVCAALWSLSGPLIKLLYRGGEGASGATIAFYRSLLSGLLLLPFVWGRRAALSRAPLRWRLASVAAFTVTIACFVFATIQTSAANAIVLQETGPLWVFLLSPLVLKERAHPGDGWALGVAMAGVAIIFLGHPAGEVPALLVALTSGLGYGSLTVALRRLRGVDPAAVTCLNCLGCAALLAAAVPLAGSFRVTAREAALLLVLAVFQFTIPYVLLSWALQRVEALRASLILLLEMLLNPIWTYLAVRESVPPATVVGGFLVLASVVSALTLAWRRERRPEALAPEVPVESSGEGAGA